MLHKGTPLWSMQSQWTSPLTFTGNWQNLPDLMRSEHLMGFLSLKAILLPSWTFERHRGSEEANIWVKCQTWQNLITRQICWWTLTSPVGHLWHLWPHLLDTSPLWSRFFSATPSPSSSGTPRWRPLKSSSASLSPISKHFSPFFKIKMSRPWRRTSDKRVLLSRLVHRPQDCQPFLVGN